jgi:ABC-2 type transport system permease protein
MSKYFQLAKITFEEYLVYRLNFILWRFRSLITFLTPFFFWLAIYGGQEELLGYQKTQMITYVVGVVFLRSIILASRSTDLAGQIRSGELTKIIIAPWEVFSYYFTRDVVDKVLNVFFAVLEMATVLLVFEFPLYFPKNLETYLYFFLIIVLAIFLYFFLSLIISLTGFWTEDVWATRWLFGIIFLEFFAGAFFPLDILPFWLQKIIYLTPFPYLVFYPLKIWLGQISGLMAIKAILICFGWLGFFYWLTRFLWQKGIKNYGAYGG